MIPRFTAGYMSAISIQPTLMTGFSDSVTLGAIGKIKQNPAVVMRIKVEGDPARASEVTGAESRSRISTAAAGSRPTTIPPS